MNDSTVLTSLPESDSVSGATQHYDGCPCGTCQGLRAAQPVAAAIQAKHLSGASLGKLVAWDMGHSLTGERQWSPTGTITGITHAGETVTLDIEWDAHNWEDLQLDHTDWVRITAPPADGQTAA